MAGGHASLVHNYWKRRDRVNVSWCVWRVYDVLCVSCVSVCVCVLRPDDNKEYDMDEYGEF